MKKIDLHIHTIKTDLDDHSFSFSMKKLIEYIQTCKIDCIAITNHNCFNLAQFSDIEKELNSIGVQVLPGIEISIGQNGGHLLCLADNNYDGFFDKCCEVNRINNSGEWLSFDQLSSIFKPMNNYVWIPHIDKDPAVNKNILGKMKEYIFAGEVSSIKKFLYYSKSKTDYTPVVFSDFRPEECVASFPNKQVYIDVDNVSVRTLNRVLRDKTKVVLSPEDGNNLFRVLPDLCISSGLNVIIGQRSSGKTVTLNEINETQVNAKYIRQFSLLERDEKEAAKKFAEQISNKRATEAEEYLKEFKNVVEDVLYVNLDKDDVNVNAYVESLLKNAKETERNDVYSKCSLWSETKYTLPETDNLVKLIRAVELLLDTVDYRTIIEKHIDREKLIAIHTDLIRAFREKSYEIKLKTECNSIIDAAKNELTNRTAATAIEDIDFKSVLIDKQRVKKFEAISKKLKSDMIIATNKVDRFSVITSKTQYNSVSDLKDQSGLKSSFKDAYSQYDSPYSYLQELKKIEGLKSTEYYKYYAKIEYKVLNEYGASISGGERAEYNLLQSLHDAYLYDILLVDEPESSFDNLFLYGNVNRKLKEISRVMPVVLATHNSSIGMSIKPDYIIYTKRKIINGQAFYDRYYGYPSNQELINSNGETINLYQISMESFEAGEQAYNERRADYELLKN